MSGVIVSTGRNQLGNSVNVTVPLGLPGPPGPPGAAAQWDSMTQEEYDDLSIKDPNTLYVIVP